MGAPTLDGGGGQGGRGRILNRRPRARACLPKPERSPERPLGAVVAAGVSGLGKASGLRLLAESRRPAKLLVLGLKNHPAISDVQPRDDADGDQSGSSGGGEK